MASKVPVWPEVACAICEDVEIAIMPPRNQSATEGLPPPRRHRQRQPNAFLPPVSIQEDAQPRRYKALLCERLGDPQEALGRPHSALTLTALPAAPLTHPSGVRIRVAAAALNFADALQLQASRTRLDASRAFRFPQGACPASVGCFLCIASVGKESAPSCLALLQGRYQEKPKLPFTPGSECSGTVVEVGRDVRTVKVGDKVRLPCST